METLGYDVAQEYIGPLKNTIEVIDTHGVLAKVTSENAEGKFSLFCPNHLLSKRKWLGTLPVDFFMTKKYLQSQGISIMPVTMANHVNPDTIIGQTAQQLLKVFIGNPGYVPVYTTAGRKVPLSTQRKRETYNQESFQKAKTTGGNIWISPYENTRMHPTGKQEFGEETKDELANTFAKESKFGGYDIIPLYMYEDKTGKYIMNVGAPISKEGKKVNDVKLEYLQTMKSLKEQTLAHVANKNT